MMNNIMVDLETLGTVPGCAILSIGAIAFDHNTGQLGSKFYKVINYDSCDRLGLYVDPRTLQWWEMQSTQSQKVLTEARAKTGNVSLSQALTSFNSYIQMYNQNENVKVWGYGSDFDNAILQFLYSRLGITPEWKYWNNRCLRTLRALFPDLEMQRTGTYHNALDDAITQAVFTVKLLRMIK